MIVENELAHFGVLGMKWGVRRTETQLGKSSGDKSISNKDSKKAAKQLKKSQKKWDKNYNANWLKAYNKAVDQVNNKVIPELNKKYKKYDWSSLTFDEEGHGHGDSELVTSYEKYYKEYNDRLSTTFQQSYDSMFGKRPE